jgi:quaternary ammonium compound-resistance protein SugE
MGLKYSEGFTRLSPTLLMFASGALSFYLLSVSMKSLPVGTVVLGIVFLDEPRDLFRLVSVSLIVIGIVGLRLTSSG